MAIQQWTIIKLVGPAAADAVSRFERWWAARHSDDMSCFVQSDWRPAVRRDVAAYLARLEEHRWEMPVAYFSQHIDRWLAGDRIRFHLGSSPARVLHDAGELWCYRLPDRGKLVRRNRSAARDAQFPEIEWLAQRLLEAARAHEQIWPRATLLINRQAITVSPTDEQSISAAAALPKWLGRSTAR